MQRLIVFWIESLFAIAQQPYDEVVETRLRFGASAGNGCEINKRFHLQPPATPRTQHHKTLASCHRNFAQSSRNHVAISLVAAAAANARQEEGR